MLTLWRKLRWSITHRGLRGTLKAAPAALNRKPPAPTQHPFDQRYGTDTSGLIGGGSLATGHPHDAYITAYAGIPPSRFEAALDRWSATLNSARPEDYTFIDLGCGKGRAVLLASLRPFRRVVGIELNPQLAAIAQRNVERFQEMGEIRCPINIQTGDATRPSLPVGPALLFLYNSFAEPLVVQLADYLTQSGIGDCIDLIYQNAEFADVFAQSGYQQLWKDSLPLSAEDAQADPVASLNDITIQFRRL